MRNGLLLVATVLGVAACGDIESDIERAKQSAMEAGQQALNAGAQVLDTRTACLLAGQSEAFCGCLSERLGADITPERVEALSKALRTSLDGRPIDVASDTAAGIDVSTREAVVHCAARATIEGAAREGGN